MPKALTYNDGSFRYFDSLGRQDAGQYERVWWDVDAPTNNPVLDGDSWREMTEQEIADIEAQRIAASQTWQSFREGRERILALVTGYFGTLTSVNITSDMREQLEAWWVALCNAPDNCATPQEAHALLKQGPGWWVAKQTCSSVGALVGAVLEP